MTATATEKQPPPTAKAIADETWWLDWKHRKRRLFHRERIEEHDPFTPLDQSGNDDPMTFDEWRTGTTDDGRYE